MVCTVGSEPPGTETSTSVPLVVDHALSGFFSVSCISARCSGELGRPRCEPDVFMHISRAMMVVASWLRFYKLHAGSFHHGHSLR